MSDMNIMAGQGVAVREYQLTTGEAAEKLVTSFRQFTEDNKDEIEAISILYSRPYAAGLRYSQVKELARRLSIKPFHIDESQPQTLLRLWQAFGTVAPDKVDTGSGKNHCKPCFVYPEKRFKWLKRRKGPDVSPCLPMIYRATFSRSGVRFNDGGDWNGSLQR